MANNYIYFWDSGNQKKTYGGKYGNGDAGQKHSLKEKDWGTKREFKGSETNSYEFRDPKTNTIVTVRADTLKEAQRIAASMDIRQLRKRRRG